MDWQFCLTIFLKEKKGYFFYLRLKRQIPKIGSESKNLKSGLIQLQPFIYPIHIFPSLSKLSFLTIRNGHVDSQIAIVGKQLCNGGVKDEAIWV